MGNRLSQTVNGKITTYTYDNLDQLTGTTAPDGTSAYTYDQRGNLVEVNDNAGITAYTYDAQDRLTKVTLPDATVVQYGYDADGRRVVQQVNTGVT